MKRHLGLKITFLVILTIVVALLYMTTNLYWNQPKLLNYALSLRLPKLGAILIASFAIGSASFAFQTLINNYVVTPCLLGMNSLYTLTHTLIVFFLGSTSIIVLNANLSFTIDLLLMCLSATVIYGFLFKKTKNNILYILLIGTVFTSLFTSIQGTLIRVMDPNEYDALLSNLVASFTNINKSIMLFAIILLIFIAVALRKELQILDVLGLGKMQAINLGVDYDKGLRKLLIGVTFYIAIATGMVGPVSFLGLILANLARKYIFTYKHALLIPVSTFMGLITILFGQYMMEYHFHYNVPISVFITLFGGIYFLYLFLQERRKAI